MNTKLKPVQAWAIVDIELGWTKPEFFWTEEAAVGHLLRNTAYFTIPADYKVIPVTIRPK